MNVKKDEVGNWEISPDDRVCVVHKEQFDGQAEKLRAAVLQSEAVEIFSKNYKGTVAPPHLNKDIESWPHLNQDDFRGELRILAALDGCPSGTNVELRSQRVFEAYTRNAWIAKGTI